MRNQIVLALALAIPALALANALPATAAALEPEDAHRSASDPIEVGLDVAAAPSVGVEVALRTLLTPTWDGITGATVQLHVPEGMTALGATSAQVVFLAGQPAVVTFLVRADEPGTHLLAVRAASDTAHGRLGGYGQGYLVLPDSGAGVFHPEHLLAPTVAGGVEPVTSTEIPPVAPGGVAPGPTVDLLGLPLPDMPSGETGDTGDVGAASHSTFVVTGCWNYVTESGGSARQRFATVEVWDDDGLSDDLLWTGITDTTGCYTSAAISRAEECCFSGNQDIYVVYWASSTWGAVKTTSDVVYTWSTGVTTIGTQDTHNVGDLQPSSSQFANRVYQYIINGADFARNHMSISGLGSVRVFIPDSCTFFTRSDDTIHLCANNVDDKSPDDVLHEYGHYVHEKMYGDSFWPSPGGAHSLCADNQNRGLSWTEGFANFFGPRANNEVSHNGANGDVLYSRPWNGASFSLSMESNDCGVSGDDNEMNVAQSLWDLRDSGSDGFDTSSDTNVLIANVIEACDDSNYNDYYGGTCSWTSHAGNRCNFLRTAFQNSIDFNANPTAAVTSQGAFSWVRGTMVISGTASDSDGPCSTLSVSFRVSTNNICSTSDTSAGMDTTSPYSVGFNTAAVGDGSGYYACALANDGIEDSAWDVSAASFGIDNTLPSVSHSLSGTVGSSGWYRSAVTATVSCSDATSGVASRQYSLNGGAFQAYGSAVTISAQGSTTFQSRCTDNAGNVASSAVSTISIDTNIPSTSASLSGTAGSGGWYRSAVTTTLSCSDPVPGSGCSFNQYNLDGAGFVTGNGVTVSGQGAHTFQYRSQDVAGNLGNTGSAPFSIDSVAPSASVSLSGTLGSGGYYRSAVSVTLTCTDATSGVASRQYSLDGGAYQTYVSAVSVSGQGSHTFVGLCADVAGNQASQSSAFAIDSVAPTSAATKSGTLGSDGWYRSPVSLAVSCSDPSPGSGCTAQHNLDGAGFVAGTSLSVSAQGAHTFAHRALDGAGNVGAETSDPFKIDSVAPSLSASLAGTLGNAGWYRSAVQVTLSCTDATSGVNTLSYQLNGGPSTPYAAAFTVSNEGANTVVSTCVDRAGNSVATTRSFSIDTRTPGTTASLGGTLGDNGWYRSPVTVALSCSDPAPGSGCAITERNLDGAGFVAGTSFTESGQGSHTLAYRSADAAGNVEVAGNSPFRIDSIAPSLSMALSGTEGNAGWYTSAVQVSLTCSDATSGVASRSYRVNGGPSTPYAAPFTVSTEGTSTIVAECRDSAGNVATSTQTVKIDTQAPTATVSAPAFTVGAVSVEWTAEDATSGLTGTLELQEAGILGEFSTVCTFALSGTTASDSCMRALLPGQYCWRVTLEDVAGNRATTLGTTCTLVIA